MRRKGILLLILFLIITSLASFGCAKKGVQVDKDAVEKSVQNGVGKDRKFDDALDLALRDALKKAVVEIIGRESEKSNKDTLTCFNIPLSQYITSIIPYSFIPK